MYRMTAAHKTLPLPTYVSVRNLSTGREIVVRVNDRGPFHEDRILDLSYAAATKLGIVRQGTGVVEVRALVPDSAAPAGGDRDTRSIDPPARSGPIRLFVQAGSFRASANAARLSARLAAVAEVPVGVRRVTSDGGVMYRVWVGPVSDVDEAGRISSVLGTLGIEDPRIVVE